MKSYTIPLLIIISSIVIAGVVYFTMQSKNPYKNYNVGVMAPISTADHILGNPTAKVMIVEYSDFDCLFCKDFHQTLRNIMTSDGATGKVAWVFRHFPLSERNKNAVSHARASECMKKVAGNDAFWKFSDELFANQPTDPARYGELANKIGISDDAFAKCIVNTPSEIDSHITADRQNALDMGAEGAPYSIMVVEGKVPVVIPAAYPYFAIKQLIDDSLEK